MKICEILPQNLKRRELFCLSQQKRRRAIKEIMFEKLSLGENALIKNLLRSRKSGRTLQLVEHTYLNHAFQFHNLYRCHSRRFQQEK